MPHHASITGSDIISSLRAIRPEIDPAKVPQIRWMARGKTLPQVEIGPITTTSVISGQVPSGIPVSRTSKKVSKKAMAMRTPCTLR